MKSLSLFLVALGVSFGPALLAQERPAGLGDGALMPHRHAPGHHCAQLFATPEGRAALAAFAEARDAGRLADVARTQRVVAVGDTMTFNVRTKIQEPVSNHEWVKKAFVLKAETPVAHTRTDNSTLGFRIWVEVDEVDNVSPDDVTRLQAALGDATPATSINPAAGILGNSDEIFGRVPNYDQDGIVDFLLTDIIEGDSNSGSTTVGFFDPMDIQPGAAPDRTNQRDILYIDTNPGITGDPSLLTILSTLAHEHQHLIHANYDGNEDTFVNEGLSEWAPVLNGYAPINTPSYLQGGSLSYNVRLLKWEGLIDDYARGGLFTSYLAEQFGAELIGSITRETANGAAGYDKVLTEGGANRSLAEILLDFHTANFLNDSDLDATWGYVSAFREAVGVTTDLSFNGSTSTETTLSPIGLVQSGGVEYVSWRNVEDLELTFRVLSGAAVDRIGLRAVLERPEGGREVVALSPSQVEPHVFAGAYERVTLIVVQIAPGQAATGVSVTARWMPTGLRIVEAAYDDGSWETFFLVGNTTNAAYATRFGLPDGETGAQLSRVLLPNYYINQFSADPNTERPRDFRFGIWGVAEGGGPGEELFGLDLVDERPFEQVFSNDPLKFAEVDLRPHFDDMPPLPEQFYLGATNAGSDDNYIAVPISVYTTENITFISDPPSATPDWRPMWNIELTDGGTLRNRIVPVRAEFQVAAEPVPITSDDALPRTTRLAANYPNPFNPTTVIPYDLAEPGLVRLTVYDVLGREVARLVDETLPAGAHAVQVDAGDWPSGLYVYVLETPAARLSRMMTLVR